MPISLLVADDHEVVRSGIAIVLRDVPDITIVAQVSDGEQALEKTIALQPDVVLMDIRMTAADGLTALEAIHARFPELPIVMHSMYDNPTFVARAIAWGACDYILKGSPFEDVVAAIRRAARHEAPPAGSLIEKVRTAMATSRSKCQRCPELTFREVQVLRHLALGLNNREIGRSMDISLETVKEYVQNVLRKTNSVDRTQAAVWALCAGLGV